MQKSQAAVCRLITHQWMNECLLLILSCSTHIRYIHCHVSLCHSRVVVIVSLSKVIYSFFTSIVPDLVPAFCVRTNRHLLIFLVLWLRARQKLVITTTTICAGTSFFSQVWNFVGSLLLFIFHLQALAKWHAIKHPIHPIYTDGWSPSLVKRQTDTITTNTTQQKGIAPFIWSGMFHSLQYCFAKGQVPAGTWSSCQNWTTATSASPSKD